MSDDWKPDWKKMMDLDQDEADKFTDEMNRRMQERAARYAEAARTHWLFGAVSVLVDASSIGAGTLRQQVQFGPDFAEDHFLCQQATMAAGNLLMLFESAARLPTPENMPRLGEIKIDRLDALDARREAAQTVIDYLDDRDNGESTNPDAIWAIGSLLDEALQSVERMWNRFDRLMEQLSI